MAVSKDARSLGATPHAGLIQTVPGSVGADPFDDPDVNVSGPSPTADPVEKSVERCPEPPRFIQETDMTCWAAALRCWLWATGAVNERAPKDRYATNRNLINYYRGKLWTDGKSYLILDNPLRLEALRIENDDQVLIWRAVCSEGGGEGGGCVETENKEGHELSYDYLAEKLRKSYVLMAEKRAENWAHNYVIWQVLQRKSGLVEFVCTDPDYLKPGRYLRPLRGIGSYRFWVTTRDPSAGAL